MGPPQLRDFRLPGERQTPPRPATDEPLIQPRQQTPPPAAPRLTPAPAPAAEQPPQNTARPAPPRRAAPQQPRSPVPAPADGPAMTPAPAPMPENAVRDAQPQALPAPPAPAPGQAPAPLPAPAQEPAPQREQGYSFWLYLLPVGLALLAAFAWRRRRATAAEPEVEPAMPLAAPPPPPRPAPKPRPWIELEFRPERAAATLTEANVQFELVVRNTGGSPARNIRIEARMFNAGREQDKEIGAFFRRAAAEVTKSTLPALEAESETTFRSVVTMPRESMRAVNVQGRTLFVPMVAFNVFYEWSGNRRGQTSRSYVVGREPDQPAERMAPFRLDLGPRIYRTVGQREHSLARRV